MDRRVFLKLTGLVAAASALEALPVSAQGRLPTTLTDGSPVLPAGSASSVRRLVMREPGTYRITGRVRLQEPLVEISGIANSQRMSWSRVAGQGQPVASFVTIEHVDQPSAVMEIMVRGGQLESLSVTPLTLE